MQYVRNISDSVSTAWNSINPATLSGAIDVIVVEDQDGNLSCSPFHVRFGKFSLLRPYEKKVEFRVNGVQQDYAMKLGEGGEAFFVFETTDTIPQSLQTSPLASPSSSPPLVPETSSDDGLQEPEYLQLDGESNSSRTPPLTRPGPTVAANPGSRPSSRPGLLAPVATSPAFPTTSTAAWAGHVRQSSHSDGILPSTARVQHEPSQQSDDESQNDEDSQSHSQRPQSPPPLEPREALERAKTLSIHLSAANIANNVTETGDLMLDMTGYKSSEEDAIRAEVVARKILSEELEGDYDIGALFGMDEEGNLWIYSSEEAKDAAMKKMAASLRPQSGMAIDAASDPGYQSDDSTTSAPDPSHRRSESDVGHGSIGTPPTTPGSMAAGKHTAGNPNKNYAKTLRLTSDQLKALNLKAGENSMSFTVNRATCQCNMYLWKEETPVVISDIDGTITKSDALGHVLNMIGRDWTHAGVGKLYSDIVANGYNIMYLTSRSVGLADMTRAYLNGITQDGYRVPRGPTILSPDRTMAALRREVYLRKPHIFKMATLRDIRSLYGPDNHCFYAGFGNRLTDQISYRTVDVPRNRIFTINSNAEVSLDLLSLNKLRMNYVSITEVVDHYFPPVSTLVKGGGEDFTDFKYWRDTPLELVDFSASESDDDDSVDEEVADEDEELGQMAESYMSQDPEDAGDYGDIEEGADNMTGSIMEYEEDYADDESEDYGDDDVDTPHVSQGIDDGEDDQLEMEEDEDRRVSIDTDASVSKPTKHSMAVPDLNAELITGMANMNVEKSTDK